MHTKGGWLLQGAQPTSTSDLAKDDSRLLNGMWTSKKPKGPEYAVCNMATGTDSDNSVVITSYKYEAKIFKPFVGKTCEDFEGTDIKLVSKDAVVLNRGDNSEMLIEWLPPEPDQISIRTCFPKPEEADHLPQIWESKCMELSPTS